MIRVEEALISSIHSPAHLIYSDLVVVTNTEVVNFDKILRIKVKYLMYSSIKYFKRMMVSQIGRSQVVNNVHLSVLTSFSMLNTSKAMKIINGNGKPALKCGHHNLGSGIIFNKFHHLETILSMKRPDILGLSETIMDEQSEALLLDLGLSVETKQDSQRISVVVKDSVVYLRRLDLEIEDMPAI